jgi:hypothetical protein
MIRGVPAVLAIGAIVTGCSTVSLAPGADQVNVTRNAAEVAACASLGSVSPPKVLLTDPDAERQMQNETLDLGGNVLLLTTSLGRSGIAYHCGGGPATPSARSPATPAAAAAATAPPAAAPAAAPVPAEIVQAQVDAYNRRDLEAFLSFYSDDAQILDYPAQPLMAGKEAMRERYRKLFEPAPQLHADIMHRIAFDRFVIDREHVTGRPDGQAIDAVAIYEIRDGRIVRVTFLRR